MAYRSKQHVHAILQNGPTAVFEVSCAVSQYHVLSDSRSTVSCKEQGRARLAVQRVAAEAYAVKCCCWAERSIGALIALQGHLMSWPQYKYHTHTCHSGDGAWPLHGTVSTEHHIKHLHAS